MRLTPMLVLVLSWAAPAGVPAADQMEELPPPKKEPSVLVKAEDAAPDAPAPAFGLVGPNGRHYVVGSIAVADYQRGGQRHVVTLAADESDAATRDENFLYLRETNAGHRWAIARQASPDQRYRVYFRAAGERGAWQLFQRAQVTWDQVRVEPAPMLFWNEATCGGSAGPE